MIRAFFKRLMCKHVDMQHVRNIHGDEINFRGGKRSVWQCQNCSAVKLGEYLHYEPKEAVAPAQGAQGENNQRGTDE